MPIFYVFSVNILFGTNNGPFLGGKIRNYLDISEEKQDILHNGPKRKAESRPMGLFSACGVGTTEGGYLFFAVVFLAVVVFFAVVAFLAVVVFFAVVAFFVVVAFLVVVVVVAVTGGV